jgi:prepilin-type N-terminal cleavage/methylation domain-containing protein
MRFLFRANVQVKKRNGFTLIETLIALAITGVVAAAVVTTMYQVQNVSNLHYANIIAVSQVENAVHYMNRDIQSAQVVAPHGAFGFPLNLTWVDWNTNVTNTVTYSLQSDTPPLTTYSIVRTLNQDPSTTIARFIVSYPFCNTIVTDAAAPGNTVLKVASTSAFTTVGSLQLSGEPLPVTYSGKTPTSFIGIPLSGSGSLTSAHAIGESVTTYSSYCSYDSAINQVVVQITSDVARGGKRQEERRQLVINPRPGS